MAMKLSCRQIFGAAALAALLIPMAVTATEKPLRIVELFTSHGCSSCPLGELLDEDPSLMALEYHVDYWNSLVHAGSPAQLQALAGTSVSLVRYIDSTITPVTGGENKNLELINHHIVYEISSLGDVDAQLALNVTAAAPIPGEGCVVIVQNGAVSPVHAAAECP